MVACFRPIELMGKQHFSVRKGCVRVNVSVNEFSVTMIVLNTLLFVDCIFRYIPRASCGRVANCELLSCFTNSVVPVARPVQVRHDSIVVLSECRLFKRNAFLIMMSSLNMLFVSCCSVLLYSATLHAFITGYFFSTGECPQLTSVWRVRSCRCEYKRKYCPFFLQNG